MNRFPVTAALAALGLIAALGAGTARAQYTPYCPGTGPVYAPPPPPTAAPFVGSNYAPAAPTHPSGPFPSGYSNFLPQSYSSSTPGYVAGYCGQGPVKYEHFFDYNYPKPAYDRSYYLDPGPYFFTQTQAYSPSYYSYYYVPGYFRY